MQTVHETTQEKQSYTHSFFSALQPCLSGKTIAEKSEIKSLLIELRQLISSPNDIYKELYMLTIYHFLELCQAMPENLQDVKSQPYSLAKQHLTLAIAVLKLRRGQMLPQNSNSETVAEQEPLWTYALFTASLLYNIQRIQLDRTVELYKNENEKLGIWHPVVGSLYEPHTYYKLSTEAPILIVNTTQLQTILLEKIIPAVGMRWLSGAKDIFQPWFQAITIPNAEKNMLLALIQKAANTLQFFPNKIIEEII